MEAAIKGEIPTPNQGFHRLNPWVKLLLSVVGGTKHSFGNFTT